jgi:protease-4
MRLFGRSKNRLAVIKIEGIIADSDSIGADRTKVIAALKEAERRKVRGIVLRVNSPGGTVAACQEVFSYVVRVREKGIPVVASMGDVAASGGVYVSMAASEIVANPGTITGSIGVIIRSNDLSDLYHKVGVSAKVVKSGPYKDMLSTYRSLSPEEEALLQGVIDDSYDQFVEVVAESRKRPREEIKRIADGRIMTGRQAVECGLVDSLGGLETAIERAASLARVEGKPRVIPIQFRKSMMQRLLRPLGYAGTMMAGQSLAALPMWLMPNLL